MGLPCYDPVTGKPEYNVNAPDPNLPVAVSQCPCEIGVDAPVFSVPLGAGLTGCTTGFCGAFTGDWMLIYNSDFPSESKCGWAYGDGNISTASITLNYDGSAILELWALAAPRDRCWYGTAAAIACIGDTVFTWTEGTCTVPATITVTGA